MQVSPTVRIRKTTHRYWWVEEQKADGTWLIVDSYRNQKAARAAALEEEGRTSWQRIQGHQGRISWIYKDDWRFCIWHKQVMRDRPYVVLDHAQRELGRWATLNQARIALLLCRAELP